MPCDCAERFAGRMMSVTNAALREILEGLERKWVAIFQASLADNRPWPAIAGSDIQFFSIDFPTPLASARPQKASHSEPKRLLIVCVEINYKAYPRGITHKGVPYISGQTQGLTWVVDDPKKSRSTRRALNLALTDYLANRDAWARNGYASSASLLQDERCEVCERPLVLIKTFLSPFLSAKPWAIHARSLQTAALKAWDPNQHICDLCKALGRKVDLWIIEGTSLWPHFIPTSRSISKWLLTPTLSFESQRNKSIETFSRTPRREVKQRVPTFPAYQGDRPH